MDIVRVDEDSTRVVTFTLLDEANVAVPGSALTEATLTLFDLGTASPGSPVKGIINDRNGQDVLNTNGVTIDEAGLVTWELQSEDNIIVTPRRQVERHRAMFRFTWPDGDFLKEFEIEVLNLRMAS
jgi:hypothetical protein